MNKLNKKGFAISTVIYGLSIMGILIVTILMGTMSTTRKNTKDISKAIEAELNRFSKTNTTFKAGSEAAPISQEYIVPEGQSGYYRIELWGAQGGTNGGLGAYTSGIIKLLENTKIYFYIGKKGDANKGGGSTDVRINKGGYGNSTSYSSRIMVAAGGGVTKDADGGTFYGYSPDMKSLGGVIDIDVENDYNGSYNLKDNSNLVGFKTTYKNSELKYAKTGSRPTGSNGGGGGYNSSNNSNIGGTSYISGYAGQDTNQYGYFLDGQMFSGANKGDGKAHIEKVADITEENSNLKRKNTKLDDVILIKDCLSQENENITENTWTAFSIKVAGQDVSYSSYKVDEQGFVCKEYKLTTSTNIDELAVWHQAGIDYLNHVIKVKHSNEGWDYLKKPVEETKLSETETVKGYRISAYQPDYLTDIPDSGSYYIIPILSENKCLTVSDKEINNNFPVLLEPFNGSKRQIWSINKIDEKLKDNNSSIPREFIIEESASHKALSVKEQENIIGNNIITSQFNQISRIDSSIWQAKPVGNGTYVIFTSNNSVSEINPYFGSHLVYNSSNNNIIIGKNNFDTTRVKLIALNY